MNICILTYGSRGDVEPFVALSEGLMQKGHQVHLAAPQTFENLITSRGIAFTGLPGDPQSAVEGLVDEAGKNWFKMMLTLGRFVFPLAKDVLTRAQQAANGADLIIHSFLLTGAGYEIAKKKGIPDISAQFFPVYTSTGDFPSLTSPNLPLGRFYRFSTHQITNAILKFGNKAMYRWVQRKSPELPDLTGWAFDNRDNRRTPVLYAISPQVISPPKDWPATAHLTGYWSLPGSAEWTPDPKLLRFLDTGSPPIVVCFGSTETKKSAEIALSVRAALIQSGERGILVGKSLFSEELPENILYLDYIPYEWLFPRASIIVHHGGAGTTGVALKAGIPNIVVPFASDQPFWGRRVHQLGVGPKPIFAGKLSSRNLGEAIQITLNSTEMREKAKSLGAKLQSEDGVRRAIELIELYAK